MRSRTLLASGFVVAVLAVTGARFALVSDVREPSEDVRTGVPHVLTRQVDLCELASAADDIVLGNVAAWSDTPRLVNLDGSTVQVTDATLSVSKVLRGPLSLGNQNVLIARRVDADGHASMGDLRSSSGQATDGAFFLRRTSVGLMLGVPGFAPFDGRVFQNRAGRELTGLGLFSEDELRSEVARPRLAARCTTRPRSQEVAAVVVDSNDAGR